jgi:hypothetical protein
MHTMQHSLSPESKLLQLVKKFSAFMEPESSLPQSQVPATCPYPEPARSSPYLHTLLHKVVPDYQSRSEAFFANDT